jgi:hypothetical protein
MEEDSPCPARVLGTRQLISSSQEFLARKQVCKLNHSPYSPDLSPCDYFLFPKLKFGGTKVTAIP